ncbi:MAG: hypothetical protein MAG581_01340 [Deltaproteobacteria bacterium]|nr:hypothetical protein [Deltaproteobacteria bacterium]
MLPETEQSGCATLEKLISYQYIRRVAMKIDVFDTYASSKKGEEIHFDVLLPTGGDKEDASRYARDFLEKIGESSDSMDSCEYCHAETAKPEVEKQIQAVGHTIVKLEGCPDI